MIADNPQTNESSDHPLDRESDPQRVPEAWLQAGINQDVSEGDTRYYALQYVHSRTIAKDPGVLAGHKDGRGEHHEIHVRYVRGDGARATERSYPARVVETQDGLRIEPAGLEAWPAVLAVDGTTGELASIERSAEIVRLLAELHDVHPQTRVVDVESLLATSNGDEFGPRDGEIVECECGTLLRQDDEYHGEVCEYWPVADQDGGA